MGSGEAGKAQIKLEDFLHFRFLSDLNYNPGKTRCIFTVSTCDEANNCYRRELWEIKDGEPDCLPLEKAVFLAWLDDRNFLYRKAGDKKEAGPVTRIYCRDIEEGTEKLYATVFLDVESAVVLPGGSLLLKSQCRKDRFLYCTWDQEAREKALAGEKQDEGVIVLDEFPYCENGTGITNGMRRGLFLYCRETGKTAPLTPASMEVGAFDLSDDGNKIVLIGQDYQTERKITSQIYEIDLTENRCCPVYSGEDYKISRIWYLDGHIVFTATAGERFGMMENDCFYTLSEGKPKLVLDMDRSLRFNVGSDCRFGKAEVVRKDGNALYMGVTERNATHLYRYCNGIARPVYEGEGAIDGFAPGDGEILMILMKDMKLEEIYRLKEGGQPECVSRFNLDWCDSHCIRYPEKMTIRSGGDEIDGWVLTPRNYDPSGQYPAILDIHGGPKTVYGEVYYHEMQVWANRGYFVFYCNPHGSDGRGNEFADMRRGYGGQDYRDLMNFTDQVLKDWPAINPDRVAVTGGSYGGFMTNWIIGNTDRFCCAVSQRSIASWITETISDSGHYFAVEQQFADPLNCAVEMWEHSPLRFVHRAVTPTLFIHSTEDYRCPMPEALQMYSALINKGVPSRVCCFKGENHGLSRGGKPLNRKRRLQEITGWIDRYTKTAEGD